MSEGGTFGSECGAGRTHCARVAVTVDVRVVGLERVVGATRERGALGRS